ncbi:MAG: GntG family PLP-dependent aldolase, partial [Actinomycetota bacterium]
QIAFRVHTVPGNGVLAGKHSHVVLYELGAAAKNAGIQFFLLDDDDGLLSAAGIAEVLAGHSRHLPSVDLLSIENTAMAAGGTTWPLERLSDVAQAVRGLPIHLDGARLFHAHIATGHSLAQLAGPADSVMSCLSKGLGAPVGSVLAGSEAFIHAAKDERKRFGGSMRQAGILAAAGLVGLNSGIERLAEDHARARKLAEAIAEAWPNAGVSPLTVETNVVVAEVANDEQVIEALGAEGVLCGAIAPQRIRFVTHLDVDDAGIDHAISVIRSIKLAS